MQRIPYAAAYGNGEEVAATLSFSSPTAILENSGVLVIGKTVLDAFDRLEVLETTADALIHALILGSVHPMSPEAILELEKVFFS